MTRLSSTKRERRGGAEFPICNLCELPIAPGQAWDISHAKHKPRWLGGPLEGIAHRRCNRLHNNRHDTPLFHKNHAYPVDADRRQR